MPSFVVDELRDYLRCGVLARGAVRFLCEHCGEQKLKEWMMRSLAELGIVRSGIHFGEHWPRWA